MKRLLIMGFLFGAATFSLLSCQKELSVESNSNDASFSLLSDSSSACLLDPEVNGTYYNGVTIKGDTNFVTVVVNIKTTGNYKIATDVENGFSFRDSGFFSTTGFDTLILKAVGKPTLLKTTYFTLSDTACSFAVPVNDSTGTGLGGDDGGGNDNTFADSSYIDPSPAANDTWHFTDSSTGTTYSGTFPAAGAIDPDNVLTLFGFTADLTKELEIDIQLKGSTVQPGVYQIRNSNSALGLATVSDGTFLYDSDKDVAEDGSSNSYFIITSVTSADATNNRVEGSFHCWSEGDSGGKATLIKGSFNSLVAK